MRRTRQDTDPTGYDAMVHGGVANGDMLRMAPGAVRFTQQMSEARKPAAIICHGPWIAVEAEAEGLRQPGPARLTLTHPVDCANDPL